MNIMSTTHKLNPALPVILEGWEGNPMKKGAFLPYNPELNYGDFSVVLKWQFQGNPQKAEKKADKWKLNIHQLPAIDLLEGPGEIIWLGHACFLIRIAGKTILTDPVFFDLPFVPRRSALPFPISDLTGIDYILISHDHRDHCDKKSIEQLVRQNPNVEILTTLQLGETLLKSWVPKTNFQEAGWYQQYATSEGLEIYLLPASHWCKRGAFDLNNRLWGSIIIKGEGRTIYFGADSGYETHFKQIGELFPDIDVAMIGIGAYKPEYIMKNSHTSPAEAVKAFHDLGAKELIPMHFGTFDLSDEPFGEPWREIHRMEQEGLINGKLVALEPGLPLAQKRAAQ